jgi:hypothetical protein
VAIGVDTARPAIGLLRLGPLDLGGRVSGTAAALASVSAVYVFVQILLGSLHFPLSLDEAVYASQFAGSVPRFPYAAHRAVGEGLLAAPLTMWTSSAGALRAYFVVLSGVLLYLAFLPWLKVRGGPAVPVAAALFAFTWVSLRYGASVLPNLPVALGAVAAIGLVSHPGRRSWIGLLAVLTGLTLLRPTDAAWIGIPLITAMIVVRAWRHPASLAAAVSGLAVGAAAWGVEAFARFGDPFTRLDAVGNVNGTNGLHFILLRYLASMSGKGSCAPAASYCGPVTSTSMLWWIGGLLLVSVGLVAARRTPHRPALVLCVAAAVVFGAAYVFLSTWAVPRYLLAVFALLAIPAAEGVIALARAVLDRRRRVIAAGAVIALAAVPVSMGVQVAEASRVSAATRGDLYWAIRGSKVLAKHGITGHCAVLGTPAPVIAYLRHCRAADMHDGLGARDASGDVTAANVLRLRSQGLLVIIISASPPETPGVSWWHPSGHLGYHHQQLYVSR